MRIQNLIIVLITCFLVYSTQVDSISADPKIIQEKISWLYNRAMKKFWTKNQRYQFPILWQHKKGLFESRVHFNILDKRNSPLTAFIRDDFFKIDDINMFVTSFALYGLLEAQQLGTIKVDSHMLSTSLQAISTFRDKNSPDGVPQYAFWPQVKINGTWSAQASNLVHSVNLIPHANAFEQKILDKLGLSIIGQAQNIAKAFCIPADNDDSSVNLALLGLLHQTKSTHYEFWNSLHPKKQAYYQRALKYAYRPFTPNFKLNKHADQIDPRTYFVLRQFLDMKKSQSQNPSLILPTTWLISFDQQVPGLLMMPFRSNNVDASVCANFLFGLSYQIISSQVQLTDQLKQMILDTTQLLEFTIKNILSKRASLILVYYPSRYDFYWFVARIVALLKRNEGPSPLPQIKVRLEKLMKEVATQQIIQNAQKNNNGGYLWKEFLGNYAKKQRLQDAIFSSSLALNALFDTWTTRKGNNLYFDEGIPDQVKQTIEQGVKYLISELKPKMKELNAFFSGSMKVFKNSFPYFFPTNMAIDANGKQLDPTKLSMKDITWSVNVFVKGHIDPKQYQQMLKKNWFGNPVPISQISLNTGFGLTFPFWSSRAITEVMALTSLSKYLKATTKTNQESSDMRKQQIKVI